MTTLFTRSLSNGKTLTAEYANSLLHIMIDGKPYTSGTPTERNDLPTGYTHIVRNVPLQPDEYDTWETARDNDPTHQRVQLVTRRAALRDALSAALNTEQANRDRAWDRYDDTHALTQDTQDTASIEAAHQALANFDAAHPEVQAAQHARNLRAGEAA